MQEFKKVYILLTYTGTFPSKLIKLYTKKTFSHVSISLDKDLTELYSFGRKYLRFPFIGGFIQENPSIGVFALYPDTLCRLYEIPVSKRQYTKIKQEIEKFKSQKSKYSYNFIGLAGLMLNRRIVVKDRYFCSQFVAKVLEDSKVNLFDKSSEFVTVEDFNIQLVNNPMIFEGNLQKYNK
jgi:hypothetical protein